VGFYSLDDAADAANRWYVTPPDVVYEEDPVILCACCGREILPGEKYIHYSKTETYCVSCTRDSVFFA
jgi:hypothetical protein